MKGTDIVIYLLISLGVLASTTVTPACTEDGRLEPNNCNAPVTIYVTDDDGWQIAVVDDDETVISVAVDDLPAPDGNTLITTYDQVGGDLLLYQLASGEFQLLAGPAFDGQIYVLNFNVPPDGNEYRQDFVIVE